MSAKSIYSIYGTVRNVGYNPECYIVLRQTSSSRKKNELEKIIYKCITKIPDHVKGDAGAILKKSILYYKQMKGMINCYPNLISIQSVQSHKK